MAAWQLSLILVGLVVALITASRRRSFEPMFQRLPLPLWCYAVPMMFRTAGWIHPQKADLAWAMDGVMPIGLGMLLLGVDLRTLRTIGRQALGAMLAGSVGIVLGGPLLLRIFHPWLPAEAWKSIGTLAATWTGGSLNMVAMQTILDVPQETFAALIAVDTIVAYSWMACLIWCQGFNKPLNRWLRATEANDTRSPAGMRCGSTVESIHESADSNDADDFRLGWRPALELMVFAVAVAGIYRLLARPLPLGRLVASTTGWTVLLVSLVMLGLSGLPRIRRLSGLSTVVGYPCLYVVLASLGAQANLSALWSTPIWLVIGLSWLIVHAAILLLAGRIWRIPFGLLATASQANVGGVVSAPLVGAVFDRRLVPIGLALAMAGNAVGTFLGLAAASLGRWFIAG